MLAIHKWCSTQGRKVEVHLKLRRSQSFWAGEELRWQAIKLAHEGLVSVLSPPLSLLKLLSFIDGVFNFGILSYLFESLAYHLRFNELTAQFQVVFS